VSLFVLCPVAKRLKTETKSGSATGLKTKRLASTLNDIQSEIEIHHNIKTLGSVDQL
jgi:hypothetical protein